VALLQSPSAVSFVRAAELVTLGRIIARSGAVTHFCQLGSAEKLQLRHVFIFSQP
jgi:hypothetical protein